MDTGKWRFWRRQPARQLPDVAQPATSYAGSRGCYAPGAAPAEQDDARAEATWTAPTRFDGQPVLTFGQRRQYRVRDYRLEGNRWVRVSGPDR